jgi:hypothetical protein
MEHPAARAIAVSRIHACLIPGLRSWLAAAYRVDVDTQAASGLRCGPAVDVACLLGSCDAERAPPVVKSYDCEVSTSKPRLSGELPLYSLTIVVRRPKAQGTSLRRRIPLRKQALSEIMCGSQGPATLLPDAMTA